MYTALLTFLLVTPALASPGCSDDLDPGQLSQAVDAAIMNLTGTQGWMHSLRTNSGYTHPISVASCTPGSKWVWPTASTATGMLRRVLTSGELKVAGVKWSNGGAADYKTKPDAPTGFWPSYLEAVATVIRNHYQVPLVVKRIYYANSDLVNAAVDSGVDVDMSEPYYYLSGFVDNRPRHEALHFSCVTAATASAFFVKQDSAIDSMDKLYANIEVGPNRMLGFIGAGNYHSVSKALPSSATPVYLTNSSEIEAGVLEGRLIAGYLSEGTDVNDVRLNAFETGIVSPRVVLFRQVGQGICAEKVHGGSGSDSSSDDVGAVGAIVVAVLAALALVLAVTLCVLIVKERRGSPLFTPLTGGI